MRNKTVFSALAFVASLLPHSNLSAAPLTEAHVTKIINEVKLVDPSTGDHDAKLDDVVRNDIALTTGIKSRSELIFQDNTLTRLGPESYFSFKSGTREMTLQKGTMLLQVPKGLGGAKIHTASVTAAITGTTIMMEHLPQKAIKVLVLEGTLRLSMNGRFGDSLLLTPGKMVIMSPNARRVPDPVNVDLKKVVQTSTLVNMHAKKGKQANTDNAPLPSMSKIETEVGKQQSGKDGHHLVDTNLVIVGKGTNVVIGSDELIADLTARTNVEKTESSHPAPTPVGVATPGSTPNPAPTPNSNPPPHGAPPLPPPGVYVTDNTTTIATQSSSASITTQGATYSGVIYKDLSTNGSPSGFLFAGPSIFDNEFDFDNFYVHQFSHSAVFVFDSLQLGGGITFNLTGETNNIALVGNNGITNTAGAISLSGVKNILFATKAGNITLDSTVSFTTGTGDRPNLVQFYARGGDLNVGSTFTLANSALQFAAENNAILSGGTITAKNLEVTGLQTVQFDDNANVSEVFQLNGGDVEMGGVVTAKNGFLYGSSATVNGTFNGESLTTNVTGDFTLNGSVSLTSGDQFQVTAGGTATINGTVLGNVTINANDMVFATDMTIGPSFKGELTATGGDIDATGHTLSGFDQILLSGGNFTVGSVTAKTISVVGTLAGGSIAADAITTNGLHADSVTANNTLTVNTSDLAPYSTGTISINAPNLILLAGANLNGTDGTPLLAPTSAFNLAITTGNFTLGTNVSLNGGDADPTVADPGGNGGQLDLTSSNSLTINSPISATTGLNSNNAMTGGAGGTVNLTAQNTITVNNRIEVSSADGNLRRSASGGHINIKSNATGGIAINVTSSAQLLALLDAAAPGPGGSIKFTSAGGTINMSGTAQADRGTIEITNNGANGGQINLANASLAADTIKVGALGTNGTLNIGGGSISADSLIKLYAGGSSGTIDFVENVTLSGNSAKVIAADTVIINNGKIVTILGPSAADVFTNHANYTGFGGNGSRTGTFAGQGAVTHPLSAAPGY